MYLSVLVCKRGAGVFEFRFTWKVFWGLGAPPIIASSSAFDGSFLTKVSVALLIFDALDLREILDLVAIDYFLCASVNGESK